jgi:hypothetical protein
MIKNEFVPIQATSNFPRPKNDHQHIKWENLKVHNNFSLPLSSKHIRTHLLPSLKPQSNLHYLLPSNTRKKIICESKNKIVSDHQSSKVRSIHQHSKTPQDFPHRFLESHCLYPNINHLYIKCSIPYEFQSIQHLDHKNYNFATQSHQQLCHHQCQHQCQHHQYKHSICCHNQGLSQIFVPILKSCSL